jgi:uncharacterized protein (DUF885 family)
MRPGTLAWLALPALVAAAPQELRLESFAQAGAVLPGAITRYRADLASLLHVLPVPYGPQRKARLEAFTRQWLSAVEKLNLAKLSPEDRLDAVLFQSHLQGRLRELRDEGARFQEMAGLLPFAAGIQELEETRQAGKKEMVPKAAADLLTRLDRETRALQEDLVAKRKAKTTLPSPMVANRAAETVTQLRRTLRTWSTFRQGYDPLFSWWLEQPFTALDKTLEKYGTFLKEELAGARDPSVIVGDPVGREALVAMLKDEFIPYGPDELLAIADQEFAWCEAEAHRAAQDLGFGGDWAKALEHVKNLHVGPGEQPALIRNLANEAVEYLESRQLLSIPELAKEDWGLVMMSPEAQKVSPFFLGGTDIQVSYPTNAMAQADKLMSMRGNNIHFCRATVQHELIPGHHLQGFMNARFNTHRRTFSTAFWTEGWALYWEMRLYGMGFPKSPEDRVGMLFWRMHRCARIIFSLKFHLGQMTPQQAIDFLVARVGHERANAEAEVRRSFNGSYGPLYQLAYMIGGLQFRALHDELVGPGRLTEKAFHDTVLQAGPMPLELLRARFKGTDLKFGMGTSWKFYGDVKVP